MTLYEPRIASTMRLVLLATISRLVPRKTEKFLRDFLRISFRVVEQDQREILCALQERNDECEISNIKLDTACVF